MNLNPKIRVLLADDHTLFSDGLALQLSYQGSPVDVVGQVFRGDDVLPAVLRYTPNVVLLDINLPQTNGLNCARQLTKEFPGVRVVMLTMYDYQKFIDECRSIGVAGYLLKHERAEVIVYTIEQVWTGHLCFPTGKPINRHQDDYFVSQFKLTPTEVKIIRLIHQGLSSQQIADQLYISFERYARTEKISTAS